MTNKEKLKTTVGFGPDNDALEGALTAEGLVSGDTFSEANNSAIRRASKRLLEQLLTTADTTNENGYSIHYDRTNIYKRISDIEKEEKILTNAPVINSKKVW